MRRVAQVVIGIDHQSSVAKRPERRKLFGRR
jgi:hypothetical protein